MKNENLKSLKMHMKMNIIKFALKNNVTLQSNYRFCQSNRLLDVRREFHREFSGEESEVFVNVYPSEDSQ